MFGNHLNKETIILCENCVNLREYFTLKFCGNNFVDSTFDEYAFDYSCLEDVIEHFRHFFIKYND